MPSVRKRKIEDDQIGEKRAKYALTEVDGLKKDVKNLKVKHEQFQGDLEELKSNLGRTITLDELPAILSAHQQERDEDREEAVRDLEERIGKRLTSAVNESIQDGSATLLKQMAKFTEKETSLCTRMTGLEDELSSTGTETQDLYIKIEEQEKVIAEMRQNAEAQESSLCTRMNELEDKLSSTATKTQELYTKTDEQEKVITEMRRDAEAQEKNAAKFSSEITKLDEDFDSKFNELAIKINADTDAKINSSIESSVRQRVESLNLGAKDTVNLRPRLNNVDQLKSLQERYAELQADNVHLRSEIASLRDKIDKLTERDHGATLREQDELKQRVNGLESTLGMVFKIVRSITRHFIPAPPPAVPSRTCPSRPAANTSVARLGTLLPAPNSQPNRPSPPVPRGLEASPRRLDRQVSHVDTTSDSTYPIIGTQRRSSVLNLVHAHESGEHQGSYQPQSQENRPRAASKSRHRSFEDLPSIADIFDTDPSDSIPSDPEPRNQQPQAEYIPDTPVVPLQDLRSPNDIGATMQQPDLPTVQQIQAEAHTRPAQQPEWVLPTLPTHFDPLHIRGSYAEYLAQSAPSNTHSQGDEAAAQPRPSADVDAQSRTNTIHSAPGVSTWPLYTSDATIRISPRPIPSLHSQTPTHTTSPPHGSSHINNTRTNDSDIQLPSPCAGAPPPQHPFNSTTTTTTSNPSISPSPYYPNRLQLPLPSPHPSLPTPTPGSTTILGPHPLNWPPPPRDSDVNGRNWVANVEALNLRFEDGAPMFRDKGGMWQGGGGGGRG